MHNKGTGAPLLLGEVRVLVEFSAAAFEGVPCAILPNILVNTPRTHLLFTVLAHHLTRARPGEEVTSSLSSDPKIKSKAEPARDKAARNKRTETKRSEVALCFIVTKQSNLLTKSQLVASQQLLLTTLNL